MGVKLKTIIQRQKIDFSELKGRIMAIDAPNIIMSFLNFAHKNTTIYETDLFLDRTQRVISHLYGILYRVKFLYSKNILPIFCFDGKVSHLKRNITKNQLNDFRFAQKRYNQAMEKNDKKLARKIALSKEYMWLNVIKESKQLLNALGIPVIDSPVSAEAQSAHLVKENIAHFSNSQDFDSLLFGCPRLIQNLSKSLRRKEHGRWTYLRIEPQYINLRESLKVLDIDHFQLVDLALLLKTDYFEGIKGIGPKTALKYIKKYNNLESIIVGEKDNYDFSALNHTLIIEIRKLFLLPDVLNSNDNLYWNPPNITRILHLLCKDHHLNKERVEKNTNILNDNFYQCLKLFEYEKDRPKIVQKTLDMIDY